MRPLCKYILIYKGSPHATGIFELVSTGINLEVFHWWTQVCQASTLLLKLFSLLKDVYLGSVMVASSVAGVWTSFCGWDSGLCSWTSVCHESTLLLISPIRWWLESCQVSAALDPSLPLLRIPFLPNQDKIPACQPYPVVINAVSILVGWKSRVDHLKWLISMGVPRSTHLSVFQKSCTTPNTYPIKLAWNLWAFSNLHFLLIFHWEWPLV